MRCAITVFSRNLAEDADVIGVPSPTDDQLFNQLVTELDPLEMSLLHVDRSGDSYTITAALRTELDLTELRDAMQARYDEPHYAAGQFQIIAFVHHLIPTRGA